MTKHYGGQEKSRSTYSSYFEPLKGKIITVYRGGPESKTGYLVDIQSDYLVLAVDDRKRNEESQLIYYQLSHVKSITEDTKSNSSQTFAHLTKELKIHKGKTFADLLLTMKGKNIQINQGGPEKKVGQLIDVLGSSYFALMTKRDGAVYVNIEHVKSVSEYKKGDRSKHDSLLLEQPSYMKCQSFYELFHQLSHKWVSINGGGSEGIEGVLVESKKGNFTLVQDSKVLRLQPRHVKTISLGAKGSYKPNNVKSEEKENDYKQTEEKIEEKLEENLPKKATTEKQDEKKEKVILTKNFRWKAK
ncbi:spore coat protein [Priestia megaterium]|nr:spore coat protein [Priestia megaterium]